MIEGNPIRTVTDEQKRNRPKRGGKRRAARVRAPQAKRVRVTFAPPHVRADIRAVGAAIVRGWDIPAPLMAELPQVLNRIINQLDSDDKPITGDARRFTTREQIQAGRLLATLHEANLKAAVAELQGAMIARKMRDTETVEDGPVAARVVLYLPDNGRET